MASEIDSSVFADNEMVAKSDLRTQFQIAADEITALQQSSSTIRKMAFDDSAFDEI